MNEDKDKKTYEIAFLLQQEENIRDFLQIARQHGVEPQGEARTQKINLAYKIGKSEQANFGFFRTAAFPDDVKALEKDLSAATWALRFLIIKLPKEALAGAKREARESVKAGMERKPMPARKSPPLHIKRAETLSNEALEKKIEEILQ